MKIEIKGIVKKHVVSETGAELIFSGVQLDGGEYAAISDMITAQERVRLTIELEQPGLPVPDMKTRAKK